MGQFSGPRWMMLVAATALSCCRLLSGQVAAPLSVTVPMKVENNRVFIPIQVVGPTGKSRVVEFWVDSGGGTIALSGRLAEQLRLERGDGTLDGFGESVAQVVSAPKLFLAGLPLEWDGMKVVAHLAPVSKTVFAGIDADGFLPAKVLKNYDVVFDYPHRTFTLGKAGSFRHRGAAVPLSIQPDTGFARIDFTIDSKIYGFMLDTGAAFSGISEGILSALHTEHPSWPYMVGAVGPANMVGKQFDVENKVLVLPEATLGPFQLHDVGMVSRPTGVYEKYISEEMSAPIVGALAGNVLRQFRVELDYGRSTAYLERMDVQPARDLGCVGVILQMRDNGDVSVSGTANEVGTPEGSKVRAGDRLIEVNGRRVTGLSLAVVLSALSGDPGQMKTLVVLHAGQRLRVLAPVRKYPSCKAVD